MKHLKRFNDVNHAELENLLFKFGIEVDEMWGIPIDEMWGIPR